MAQHGARLELNFAQQITNVTAAIQSTPAQLTKASNRAIRKTIRWLKNQVAREVGQALGIRQSALKQRLTQSVVGNGVDRIHILWLGVAPIAAENMGKARQTRKGVSVGKHRYQGAFYRDVYGDGEKVWIRKSRAAALGYNLPSYSGNTRGATSDFVSSGRNRGRFPVQRVAVDIEPVATEVFRRYQRRAEMQFNKVFTSELNFAVNIEKARK